MIIIVFLAIVVWVLWLWRGKRMVRPRRAAILATAIPPTLPAIATVVYALLNQEALRKAEGYTIADICWLVGFYLAVAAILSSVVFAIMRKWEIAKGTGFGSGIGLVVLLIVFLVLAGFYS